MPPRAPAASRMSFRIRHGRFFGFFRESAAQHREHRGLFRLQAPYGVSKLAFGLRLNLKNKVAVHVGAQNLRMDVTLATNSRSIAETRGDFFDRAAKIALRLRGAVEALKLGEGHRRQNRSRPGTEILRGNVLAGNS